MQSASQLYHKWASNTEMPIWKWTLSALTLGIKTQRNWTKFQPNDLQYGFASSKFEHLVARQIWNNWIIRGANKPINWSRKWIKEGKCE